MPSGTYERRSRRHKYHIEDDVAILISTYGREIRIDIEDLACVLDAGWWGVYWNKPNQDWCIRGNGREIKNMYLARFILLPPEGKEVDHIDHDRLNCCKLNLRAVTPSQNQWNKKGNRSGTSKFKGVCWIDDRRGWKTRGSKIGKSYHLGHFDSEVAAARAYDRWAIEHLGEFACLNFPEEREIVL